MSRPTLSEAEDVSIHMRAKPPDITQEGQEPSYAGHSHVSATTPRRDTDLNDWDKQFATFYDHKVHVATKGTMEVLVNHLTFNLGFLYHLPFINEYRRSGVLLAEALEELYQVSKLPIDEQVDLLDGPIDPRPLKENFIRLTALKSLLSPYEDPDGELQFKNEEGKVLLDVNIIPTASLDRIVARVWRNRNIVKEIFTALEAKYEENFAGVKKLAPARAFICLPDPLTTPARNRDSPATFLTPKPDIREQLSSIDQSSISNVRTPSPPSANIGEEKRKVAPSTIKTGKPESVSFQPTIASLEPHVPPVGHTTDVKPMSQPRDSVVEPRTPSNITGERTSFRNNPREHQDLSTHPFFRNSPAARSVTQEDFDPNPIDDKEEEEDPDPEHFYDSLATLNQGRSTVTTIPKEYRLVKRTTTLPTSYKYTSNSEFSAFRKRFDLWCSTNNVGYLVDPLFHSVYDLHGYDAIKHYIDPKTKEKLKFNPAQFPHDLSTLHTWLMDALVNTEVSHFAYDNSDGITVYRNLIADCDSEANRRTRANSWKTRLYRPYHANTDLVTFISTFREDVNKYNLEVLRPQDAIDDTAQRRLLIDKLIGCDDQAISTLAQIADSNNNYESMTQLCTFLTSKARQMDDRARIYSRNRAAKRHVNVARAESPTESTTNPDDEQMDVQLFAQVLNAMQHDAFDLTESQYNKLPSEVKKVFRQARYYARKYHKEKKNQRQNAIKNDGQQGLPGQYSKPKKDANNRQQENPPPNKVNLARQPDATDDASLNNLSTDGFFSNLEDIGDEDVNVLLAAASQDDFICNLIHCDATIDPSVFDPLEPDPNAPTIHSEYIEYMVHNTNTNNQAYAISDNGAQCSILGGADGTWYVERYDQFRTINIVGAVASMRKNGFRIATAITKVQLPDGNFVILRAHECAYNPHSKVTLLSEYQLREKGGVVDSVSHTHLTSFKTMTYGKQEFCPNPDVTIPFINRAVLMTFNLYPPTMEDIDTLPIYDITEDKPWIPRDFNNDLQPSPPLHTFHTTMNETPVTLRLDVAATLAFPAKPRTRPTRSPNLYDAYFEVFNSPTHTFNPQRFLAFLASQFRGGYKNTDLTYFLAKMALQRKSQSIRVLNTNPQEGTVTPIPDAVNIRPENDISSYDGASPMPDNQENSAGNNTQSTRDFPRADENSIGNHLPNHEHSDYLEDVGFKMRAKHSFKNLELLRPYFAWAPTHLIKETLKRTTQLAKAVVRFPMIKHLRPRFPHLNVKHINEIVATDTFFANAASYEGYSMIQVFYGTTSHVIDIYGLRRRENVKQAFRDFISEVGAPIGFRMDGAAEQTSQELKDICREHHIRLLYSEPHFQHQNPAELRAVKFLKYRADCTKLLLAGCTKC